MNEVQTKMQIQSDAKSPNVRQEGEIEVSAPVIPEFPDVHIRLIFAKERNPVVPKQVREILKQSYLQRNAVS